MSSQHTKSTLHNELITDFYNTIFKDRELEKNHGRYSQEIELLNHIKDGDVTYFEGHSSPFKEETLGSMSRNPIRQQMYAFVAIVTLVTRFSIEGGFEERDAYHLSDVYIQRADSCTKTAEIMDLYSKMYSDFAIHVKQSKKEEVHSAPILLCMDYIYTHLHYKITLTELAEHAGFQAAYFTTLFKKETGLTITGFIHQKRVEEAKSLLRYSEYNLSEISQYLGFCSQSHFTAIFRKYTNMTPRSYKERYFRKNWS
ncbi:MAG: AraC family transcriptional regulator [Anaerocolumna sp.]